MKGFTRTVAFGVLTALVLMLVSTTRTPEIRRYVKDHYRKYEVYLPMRDGVRLFTSVYVPRDRSQTYPILLTRTPYGVAPYGAEAYRETLGPSPRFMQDGFIFVYQDVRGKNLSEGEFVDVRPICADGHDGSCVDESTDAYDTIDWLVKHERNNGRVGMWGVSYPGFYASAALVHAHPALRAASPQAPVTEWFVGEHVHHNGALYLASTFNFFKGFGRWRPKPTTQLLPALVQYPSQDGYRFYLNLGPLTNVNALYFKNEVRLWNDVIAHPNYDAFWQARDVRRHLSGVKPAVLTVGGWFDNEDLFGALETYKAVQARTPGADSRLVMGPWFHGGWELGEGEGLGPVRFGSKTSTFYRNRIEFPFFAHYLKGAPDPALPRAYVFNTGRNVWRRFDAWPPAGGSTRSLYLRRGGGLSFRPPRPEAGRQYDEFVSDPARPVPFAADVVPGMTREYMVDDQRFAAARPDVLVYQTGVLTEDVTIAGPIQPNLVVSTSGTDSDWIVKVIDVYPDNFPDAAPAPGSPSTNPSHTMGGYQQLVRGEVMRGRFRTSLEKPQPFAPNVPTSVAFVMPDAFHTFRRGHRIMVQIQSTWFPLFDRNPQRFVDVYTAKAADFQKATQRVYRGPDGQSRIDFVVLE